MTQTAHLAEDSKEALSRAADRAEDAAADLRDETVQRVGAAVSATRKAGTALAHDLAERASETAGHARDLALDRAEAARGAVSDAGARIADGVRAAAEATEGVTSRSLAAVAGGLDQAATSLADSNLAALVGRTRDFARRNPATFVIGTAVVGYALIRLLRSSSADAAPAVAKAVETPAEKPVRRVAAKAAGSAKPAVKSAAKPTAKTSRAARS
jgi:hypothetical protein